MLHSADIFLSIQRDVAHQHEFESKLPIALHFIAAASQPIMGSYRFETKPILDIGLLTIDEGGKLQKPNKYIKYLPFHDHITQEGDRWFNEIREHLSRSVQMNDLRPGFAFWSSRLAHFILLYGYHFTKNDHLKLIRLYLSILSITDLDYSIAQLCFNTLTNLLCTPDLITRDDLTIDWHVLYRWAKLIHHHNEKTLVSIILPKDISISLIVCGHFCSPYFPFTATREILEQFRPQLDPNDPIFSQTIKMLDMFLPAVLPPTIHDHGFKLWLDEFFGLWNSVHNGTVWELRLIDMFASVAWENMGYNNWEPWLPQIFTRLLRGFALPIGERRAYTNVYAYITLCTAKWVVAMLSNESACLQYLQDLFISIKSFYHPSNTGAFQKQLVDFVRKLAKYFVERVHLEGKPQRHRCLTMPESYRLTEQNITDFVNCVKDYAFISIFNQSYSEEATETCQYLSMLRPELIVPVIVDKFFSSVDNVTEPARFDSAVNCLTQIARQIVRPTTAYSQGQTYVVPLLLAVLPGIDLNNAHKTSITLDFLRTMFKLVIGVDCSSAVRTRTDLSEIEKEVCLSTSRFEEFVVKFLRRIFYMIEILSAELSEGSEVVDETYTENSTMESKILSVMFNIVHQCSDKIFRTIREMMIDFLASAFLSPKVRQLVAGLVRVIIKSHPEDTLPYLLPQTCASIDELMNTADGPALLTDDKEMITSVFQRCIPIVNKSAYTAMGHGARNLLKSLTCVYPREYRLTLENINEPFATCLPIRLWGQNVHLDQLQVQFHIPNEEETNFACELVNMLIYPELELLAERSLKLSNDERLRSLTLVRQIAVGCLHMIPRIDSEEVENLRSSTVSIDSKYQMQYPIYHNRLKFDDNLRMRLFTDMGKLLDELLDNHSDDVKSINSAHEIYTLSSMYHGVWKDNVDQSERDVNFNKKLFKNKLLDGRQKLRFLSIEKLTLQLKKLTLNHGRTLTEMDKQVVFKAFDLSTHRYSEVRRAAQCELFFMLRHYHFSGGVIVDRLVQRLNTPNDIDHDQIKGCLYVLLGNRSFFLPVNYSWSIIEKLWPAMALMNHANKPTTQTIVDSIYNRILRCFNTNALIHETNETSVRAAVRLWRPLYTSERKPCDARLQNDVQSYHNLMDNLSSFLKRDTLTWKQQKTTITFLCLLLQARVPIPSSCIQVLNDCLLHDNMEIREFAARGLAFISRLQKPARIIVEKSFQEIVFNAETPSLVVDSARCQPGDRDDNLWITYNNHPPPNTQAEWEQACFLDKCYHGYYTWPRTITYTMNTRTRYAANSMPEHVAIVYDRFLDKDFTRRLAQANIFDKHNQRVYFNSNRLALFKMDLSFVELLTAVRRIRVCYRYGLFRNFGLAFLDNFLEQLHVLVREKTHDKQPGCHQIAAEMVAGIIRGSKYWTLAMLEELWTKLTPLLTQVCMNLNADIHRYWFCCFQNSMQNIDPRRMSRLIDFFCTLVNDLTALSTVNESSLWYVLLSLRCFRWRIPAVWNKLIEQAKRFLDHSSLSVRNSIANLISMPLSFDVTVPNGNSTRQYSIDQFIAGIYEQLREAIQTAGQSSLVNISNGITEMNQETCQTLNFIYTVIDIIHWLFLRSPQPVKDGIVRIFHFLCDIESLCGADDSLKANATTIRMHIGTSYLNAHHLEGLIGQLEQISMSPKWHARRAAIGFVQSMIFANLFNARPHAKRIHALVLKFLFDEQIEVRTVASVTLSGLYQCGYFQVTDEDLRYFHAMSKIDCFTENIVKRHGGILGFCAVVLSRPYDICAHVPTAVMLLCQHSDHPHLIQKSIRHCLLQFRRTHYDSWQEHQTKFTVEQLSTLTDMFIAHNYYA